MTYKRFTYQVLKYRPSLLLDEQVNVGLLFIFEDDKQVIFKFPTQLRRLSSLHPNINISNIKDHLKIFNRKAKKISKEPIVFSLTKNIAKEEFLRPDSNSLFFTEPKFGEYSKIEKITQYYENEYFKVYYKKRVKRKDDNYLTQLFTENLKKNSNNKNHLNLFKKEYYVKSKLVSTTFDYAWQNGTANLVKSLSFDLKQEDSIQRKSVRWYGELSQLGRNREQLDYRFDLLVARPQNRKLFKSYDKAIEVLDAIEGNKKIIEKDSIKNYTIDALNSAKPLKQLSLVFDSLI